VVLVTVDMIVYCNQVLILFMDEFHIRSIQDNGSVNLGIMYVCKLIDYIWNKENLHDQ
jgi:hypothetical protein